MNAIVGLLLLTFLQLLTGMGLVSLFNVKLKPAMQWSLWWLCGILVQSLLPFGLQLLYIPLTALNVFGALVMAAVLLNLPFRKRMATLQELVSESRFNLKLYEVPALLVIIFLVSISVWRCFYMPPTSRDLTSGAEVIAEYAVREKTMINSLFSVNLETTNNQFKPPFITSLQIIYKYAGFPFGQLWLSAIFIGFLVFLYHALSAHLHRVLTGFLLVAFIAIPEMYAYSFMALFDYSNAVFFCLSFYFLIDYLHTGRRHSIAFAGLLMGFATYIRSETLILAVLTLPLLAWHCLRTKAGWGKLIGAGAWLAGMPLLLYILSISIYVNRYLPATYSIGGLVNKNLLNLQPLWQRWWDMNRELIFSEWGFTLFSYFFMLFLFILLTEWAAYTKQVSREACNWGYAILLVYLGLPLMGFVLPLMDLNNTTKRGLFKIFPLMLLYMANSAPLKVLSAKLWQWERR